MTTHDHRYAMTSPHVIMNHVTTDDDAILYRQLMQCAPRPRGRASTHGSVRQMALHAAHVTCVLLLCLTLFVVDGASIDGFPGNGTHPDGSAAPHGDPGSAPARGSRHTYASSSFLIPAAAACRRVLVFVGSAPRHRDQRDAIRESWGSVTSLPGDAMSVAVLFVLGTPGADLDPETQRDITRESQEHRDIVQADFVDSYANLTLKTLHMLEWAARYCPTAAYIVKADDDTFVNTPLLVRDLRHIVHTRFIMGDVIAGARPIRDRQSKYYTPRGVFSGVMYPKYISGSAYVMSGDVVAPLLAAARATKLFWLEDVYITGLLAARINAKHLFNAKFAFHDQTLDPCWLAQRIITLHRVTPREMRTAWKLVQNFKHCKNS